MLLRCVRVHAVNGYVCVCVCVCVAAVVTPGIHVRTEAEGSDRPTDVSVASSTAR